MKTISKTNKFIIGCALSSCLLTTSLNHFMTTVIQGDTESGIITSGSAHSMWTSMSMRFMLNLPENNPVVNHEIAILEKDPQGLSTKLRNAAAMISYVYAQTKARGLPAELALLPLVESEYNPAAKSHVGASGLWQLMPSTAAGFGLKVNANYDGRRDIVASTQAALRFLDDLHHQFNDWNLALAAYNWGPGNIEKLEKKLHGQTDIIDSKSVPLETQQYEPKLLAWAAIIKDPARYHVQLPTVTAEPKLASVQVAPNVNLTQVAEKSGISVDDMRKFNPGYTNLSTSSNTPNTVLVPADKAESIKSI